MVLKGLRKILEEGKGQWAEELLQGKEYVAKARAEWKYNAKVLPHILKKGDLVLKIAFKNGTTKSSPQLGGPYKIMEDVGKGAF
ncbi:hypothetical protein CR513_22300, partial [Mucuna pruriens]